MRFRRFCQKTATVLSTPKGACLNCYKLWRQDLVLPKAYVSSAGYCGGDAACNEWCIRPTGLASSEVLWTGGVQFAPNLAVSGRECDLMIPTLPENDEGGAKSTPLVHPNAPLPPFGTAFHHKKRIWAQNGPKFRSTSVSRTIHPLINHEPIRGCALRRKFTYSRVDF